MNTEMTMNRTSLGILFSVGIKQVDLIVCGVEMCVCVCVCVCVCACVCECV